MRSNHTSDEHTPVCSTCGKQARQRDLVATSVGYKCATCAKPVSKVRKPFKSPLMMMLLADDGLTFFTKPLTLALAAAMLAGFVGRSVAMTAPWVGTATGLALGMLLGEVTLLSAGERPMRLHAAIAVVGVIAAAIIAQLDFAPMGIGAVIAAAWLLLPAGASERIR